MSVKQTSKNRRNARSRSQIFGEESKPRICVYRSNEHIYVQALNDRQGKVIASASSLKVTDGTKSERANKVGEILGEKLSSLKIQQAMFDRNGLKFHGRVKALVEGIRSKGINF